MEKQRKVKLPERVMSILAHGDADGLASATIALKTFPDAKVYFTEPIYAKEMINKIEKPILVLDLADVTPSKDVFVVDHHPAEVSGARSNTELMEKWYGATEYLIKLGEAGDQAKDVVIPEWIKRDANDLYLLLAYYVERSRSDALRQIIVRELAKDKKIHEVKILTDLLKKHKKEIEEILDSAEKEAEKNAESIKDSIIITYPDAPRNFAGFIANRFKKMAFTVFLLWKSEEKTIVTMRTQIRDVNNLVSKLKERDPKFLSGGGHKCAGSYSTLSSIYEIKNIIKGVL